MWQRGNSLTWHNNYESAVKKQKEKRTRKNEKAVKMKIHLRNIYTKATAKNAPQKPKF